MNTILLGDTVQIIRHEDDSIVHKFGRVTAVTNTTVSVWIEPNNQSTRQISISDVKVVKNEVVS